MTLAVLFDCDGVLVDSEALSKGLMVQMMREIGVHRDPREVLHEFSGRRLSDCLDNVAAWLGKPLPENFVTDFRRAEYALLTDEVVSIPGIESTLQQLKSQGVPFAVASNGPIEKIITTLSATGLLPYFNEHVYSAYEVDSFKPDPGLYLHAAQALGVPASECVVIEDSVVGVSAGIAAGMRVLGLVQEESSAPMREIGAQTFSDMSTLPDLLQLSR